MLRRFAAAALYGAAVFLLVLFLTRTVGRLPLIAGIATFVVAWIMMVLPRKSRKQAEAEIAEEVRAVSELDEAASRLQRMARQAPAPDRPLFRRLADLMGQIRDSHQLNPGHAELTRKFRKHVVGRMVGAVASYVELTRRAGRDEKDRLAAISSQIEEFVPVLERIDRACLDNDLMALEINVEVLNEQLNRRP